jgi:protein-S-isoprenylcysteine O-methyltransferase Ste14
MSRLGRLGSGLVGVVVFVAILFAAAGRFDFQPGWLYAAMSVLGLFLNVFVGTKDDALSAERSGPGEGIKPWDKQILAALLLTNILTLVTAGLDAGRFHWTPPLAPVIEAVGLVVMLAGQLLFVLAMRTNAFFSTVARIQHDRGHAVCDTGPYAWVRHPGYTGMLTSIAALPALLGSAWSVVPTLASIGLLAMRTRLEDRMLLEELPGYRDYATNTRSRLIPGVW